MAKKVREDGTVFYYYYKKKVGRHKKRGARKKKKKRGRSWQKPWDFKIILFNFHKQDKYIGQYHDAAEAGAAKKILLAQNETVVFPKKYINNGRKNDHIVENLSEYVILKKVRSEQESPITQIRNEYGKLIDNQTTSENWAVYDKFPCVVEETFWAYGYNPRRDRKTYLWIEENFVIAHTQDTYDIVQIYLYNNKVIFRYDSQSFNFVICKNRSDAIRMYNLLEERLKKNKRVIFTGATRGTDDRARYIASLIQEKTGWSMTKIWRSTTRP